MTLNERAMKAKETVEQIIEKLNGVEDKSDAEKDAVWAEINEPFTEVIDTWNYINKASKKISKKILDNQTQ